MISKLGQIPFFRIVLPFITGITLALYFPFKPWVFCIATAVVFIFLTLWYIYECKHPTYGKRWVFGALAGIFLVMAGYSLTLLRRPYCKHSYYERYLSHHSDSLLVDIISQPLQKDKSVKATGEVVAVIKNGKQYATSGKALFYFQNDSAVSAIKYGDELLVYTYMQPIRVPYNPDAFNYRGYLALHGIYREAYVKAGDYALTGKNSASRLVSFTNTSRQKLITLLNQKLKTNEAAVASAILLGYRNDLSKSVIQRFADSGTIHVICVAGLHVGILFLLLGWLLMPLERIKYGNLIRTVLLLLLLWLYALFTGMATPVMRATVMFSFLVVGKHFGKYTNSINTLSVAAFIMLLINPFAIADVGFQLSYLSVLGIIVIYPWLNRLLVLNNSILEKAWELACLSVSAQLAIAPLSFFYFHQFPNYFVLTNLLIVPLLTVVIYAGILFFLTASIPIISGITTWLLQKSVWLMNRIVAIAHHLPFFVTKAVSLSVPEVILLYVVLLAFLAFAVNKKYRALLLALSCFVVFMGVRVCKDFIHSHQQLFVVYDIPKHSAIAFLSSKRCVMVQPIDSQDFKYSVQYHWWAKGIQDSSSLHNTADTVLLSNRLCVQHNYMQFNTIKIVLICNNSDLPDTSEKIKVNYVVVAKGYKLNIAALENAFVFDKLIFDSSVSPYRMKKWKKQCKQLHVSYYDVSRQGAFVKNVPS